MREKKILAMKKGNRIQRLGVLAGMLLLAVFALLAWPALNLAYKLQSRLEKTNASMKQSEGKTKKR